MQNSSSLWMLEAIEIGEDHADPKLRQYARNALAIFAWRGVTRPKLAGVVADVETWLSYAPKYDKRNASLQRDLIWGKDTYQQYQRGGRLLVEHLTGARAQKLARKSVTNDEWAELRRRARALAEAGLVNALRLASLATIEDKSRIAGLQPTELTAARFAELKKYALSQPEWEQVKRGGSLLDHLRDFPTLASLLPPKPIGPVEIMWRRQFDVPAHLAGEVEDWITAATTVSPEGWKSGEIRRLLAKEHSSGSRGIFKAAFGNYLDTLGSLRDITAVNTLSGLFGEEDVYRVVNRWIGRSGTPGGLSKRSMYAYMAKIRITLARNGHPEAAAIIDIAINTIPALSEGRAAAERMSPKTETWCRDLLADVDKIRLFETQHRHYDRRAREALDAAEAAGLDLVALAGDARAMRHLPKKRRSLAKKLLGQARRFGVCAAFAAIELEGAPLREDNTLGLIMSGAKATLLDHSKGEDPYFRILIPNELLKNGDYLSRRGQELPPIDIKRREPGDAGVDILKFYLKRIRPLFPRHAQSNALFPSLEADAPHLLAGTFSNWLLLCSVDMGLRLTSHNFRHGQCSIQINDDPNCIEELAIYIGDSPETVRKYYAFLNRDALLNQMQDRIAERRSRHARGRAAVPKAA